MGRHAGSGASQARRHWHGGSIGQSFAVPAAAAAAPEALCGKMLTECNLPIFDQLLQICLLCLIGFLVVNGCFAALHVTLLHLALIPRRVIWPQHIHLQGAAEQSRTEAAAAGRQQLAVSLPCRHKHPHLRSGFGNLHGWQPPACWGQLQLLGLGCRVAL